MKLEMAAEKTVGLKALRSRTRLLELLQLERCTFHSIISRGEPCEAVMTRE